MKHLLVVAVAVTSLASCALTPGASGNGAAASHACADKVAQATTTTAPVLGLWNCLTTKLQTAIKANGGGSNPDDALSIGVATRTVFLGADADFATYELILNPGTANQAGVKTAELTVWLDPTGSGKVDNVGVPPPAF